METNLDLEIQRLIAVFKKQQLPLLERLYSQELISFRDLSKRADEILSQTNFPIKEGSREEILKSLQEVFSIYGQELTELVQKGEIRLKQRKEIDRFSKHIQNIFSALSVYKDLKPSIEKLVEKNQQFLNQPPLSKEASVEEVEEIFEKQWKGFLAFSSSIITEHATIMHHKEVLEYRCQDALLTIRCRLFEAFFGITCYPDLEEGFLQLTQFLSRRLETFIIAFYEGKIGIDCLCEEGQQLAYEHDVLRMRNEVSHRALRLKDLRDELIRLLRVIQNQLRYLHVCSRANDSCFLQLLEANKKLEKLLEEVENPFLAFQKAKSKDACNEVFRSFWIRIEAIQPQVEELDLQAQELLEKQYDSIKTRFFKLLDDIEEVVFLYEGVRPSLVTRMEQIFSEVPSTMHAKELFTQISTVEAKYPFCQPLSFFMTESDFHKRREMLAKTKRLEGQVKELREFSKTMQYIKTFEEERIDAILEGFEHLHMYPMPLSEKETSEDIFRYTVHRMASICVLIEEEVFADIGLLDAQALLDVDQKRLEDVLSMAYNRAKNRALRCLHEIEKIECITPLFIRAKKALVSDLEKLQKSETPTDYLASLRLFCHALFTLRILKASRQQDPTAMGLLVLKDLHLQYQQIETSKQLTNLVMKTHALSLENVKELEVFVKKTFQELGQIPEFQAKKEKLLYLKERHKEVEDFLRSLANRSKVFQMPFEYLLGCMAFFLRKRGGGHE